MKKKKILITKQFSAIGLENLFIVTGEH